MWLIDLFLRVILNWALHGVCSRLSLGQVSWRNAAARAPLLTLHPRRWLLSGSLAASSSGTVTDVSVHPHGAVQISHAAVSLELAAAPSPHSGRSPPTPPPAPPPSTLAPPSRALATVLILLEHLLAAVLCRSTLSLRTLTVCVSVPSDPAAPTLLLELTDLGVRAQPQRASWRVSPGLSLHATVGAVRLRVGRLDGSSAPIVTLFPPRGGGVKGGRPCLGAATSPPRLPAVDAGILFTSTLPVAEGPGRLPQPPLPLTRLALGSARATATPTAVDALAAFAGAVARAMLPAEGAVHPASAVSTAADAARFIVPPRLGGARLLAPWVDAWLQRAARAIVGAGCAAEARSSAGALQAPLDAPDDASDASSEEREGASPPLRCSVSPQGGPAPACAFRMARLAFVAEVESGALPTAFAALTALHGEWGPSGGRAQFDRVRVRVVPRVCRASSSTAPVDAQVGRGALSWASARSAPAGALVVQADVALSSVGISTTGSLARLVPQLAGAWAPSACRLRSATVVGGAVPLSARPPQPVATPPLSAPCSVLATATVRAASLRVLLAGAGGSRLHAAGLRLASGADAGWRPQPSPGARAAMATHAAVAVQAPSWAASAAHVRAWLGAPSVAAGGALHAVRVIVRPEPRATTAGVDNSPADDGATRVGVGSVHIAVGDGPSEAPPAAGAAAAAAALLSYAQALAGTSRSPSTAPTALHIVAHAGCVVATCGGSQVRLGGASVRTGGRCDTVVRAGGLVLGTTAAGSAPAVVVGTGSPPGESVRATVESAGDGVAHVVAALCGPVAVHAGQMLPSALPWVRWAAAEVSHMRRHGSAGASVVGRPSGAWSLRVQLPSLELQPPSPSGGRPTLPPPPILRATEVVLAAGAAAGEADVLLHCAVDAVALYVAPSPMVDGAAQADVELSDVELGVRGTDGLTVAVGRVRVVLDAGPSLTALAELLHTLPSHAAAAAAATAAAAAWSAPPTPTRAAPVAPLTAPPLPDGGAVLIDSGLLAPCSEARGVGGALRLLLRGLDARVQQATGEFPPLQLPAHIRGGGPPASLTLLLEAASVELREASARRSGVAASGRTGLRLSAERLLARRVSSAPLRAPDGASDTTTTAYGACVGHLAAAALAQGGAHGRDASSLPPAPAGLSAARAHAATSRVGGNDVPSGPSAPRLLLSSAATPAMDARWAVTQRTRVSGAPLPPSSGFVLLTSADVSAATQVSVEVACAPLRVTLTGADVSAAADLLTGALARLAAGLPQRPLTPPRAPGAGAHPGSAAPPPDVLLISVRLGAIEVVVTADAGVLPRLLAAALTPASPLALSSAVPLHAARLRLGEVAAGPVHGVAAAVDAVRGALLRRLQTDGLASLAASVPGAVVRPVLHAALRRGGLGLGLGGNPWRG